MNKQKILDNVDSLNAEQLFECINQGDVTLDELRATGNLDASKRRAIQVLQNKQDVADNEAWEKCRYGNESALSDYISKNPTGKYVEDAKQQIDYLREQRCKENESKGKILEKVRRNPNTFTPGMIKDFLDNEDISTHDLINYGIPKEIINCLDTVDSRELELGETPDSIPEGYTEVYFWGNPGSGKTCALSAVLSTCEKLGYLEIAQGPGYNYMLQLKNIFSSKISYLPAPSPMDTTQYLPFALRKPNEKYSRSVSLIELSGEIFQCFLYKNANKPFPTQQHENTFNSLIRFLNGNNRKIHFFFVDYERENTVDDDGYTQADYLNASATFFNNKGNNLFNKTTDAIYLVVTKSDLMDCEKSKRVDNISEYLKNNNFTSFVNALRARCRENSINAKRLLGTPFSLGDVYLRQMCLFDDETSRNIIDILMRRIEPKKESVLDLFNR
jgi:hypothetical protein